MDSNNVNMSNWFNNFMIINCGGKLLMSLVDDFMGSVVLDTRCGYHLEVCLPFLGCIYIYLGEQA